MVTTPIQTLSLVLVLKTRDDVQAMIDAMDPYEKAQLSADWLARFQASATLDPWVYGFSAKHRHLNTVVGNGGFTGPPINGVVEIAYLVATDYRGKGYATEIAQALTGYAFSFDEVKLVRAHTLPTYGASQRILGKCGFKFVGETTDPEDGLVQRFEKSRLEHPKT